MKTSKITDAVTAAMFGEELPGITTDELITAVRFRRQSLQQQPAAVQPEWLTPDQTAEKLHLCKRSIRNLVKSGKLKSVRISHKVARIHSSELSRLMTAEA